MPEDMKGEYCASCKVVAMAIALEDSSTSVEDEYQQLYNQMHGGEPT